MSNHYPPPNYAKRNWRRPAPVQEVVPEPVSHPENVEEALALLNPPALPEPEVVEDPKVDQDPPVEEEPLEPPVEEEPLEPLADTGELEPVNEEVPEEDEDEPRWKSYWNKAELLVVAQEEGLEVTEENTKKEIIEALETLEGTAPATPAE